MLRIGIVVGEPSGDQLGAGLVEALRNRGHDVKIEGVLGSGLLAAGGKAIVPMEKLAVMGLVEVAGRYLELTSIRNRLKHHFLQNPPDVFIGIDAPDFNLGIESSLRKAGIKTMHYVSPSVWAWRPGRVKKIAASADKLLTLFPFEAQFYDGVSLDVDYVGHPLADQIPMYPDTNTARENLSLPKDKNIIALMPGSRASELRRHVQPFLETATHCLQYNSNLHFIINLVTNEARDFFVQKLDEMAPSLPVTSFTGRSSEVLQACDTALLASGTVTLEAMLLKKPMVVTYKMAPITYQILKRLIKSNWVSLPNILAKSTLVPEYFQQDVVPEILAPALMHWLNDRVATGILIHEFERLHKQMQQDANERAAEAVLTLCRS